MEESLGTRLLRQIKEICELAGIKTEEQARISKRRLDVLSLDREVSREKAALGARVCHLAADQAEPDIRGDETVQAILARIRNLEASLDAYEQEIGEIRDAARSRADDVRRKHVPPPPPAGGAAPGPAGEPAPGPAGGVSPQVPAGGVEPPTGGESASPEGRDLAGEPDEDEAHGEGPAFP